MCWLREHRRFFYLVRLNFRVENTAANLYFKKINTAIKESSLPAHLHVKCLFLHHFYSFLFITAAKHNKVNPFRVLIHV